MLRYLLALTGFFFMTTLSAQFCGTPQGPLLERTDENKKIMIPVQRGALKYIPITFHLVASSAGAGRIAEESILQQIASLNEDYSDQESIFYIDRFNYFDNDAVYNSPGSAAAKTQMKLRKDNNSINLFIVNNIESSGPGQTLAYYDPQDDWLVSRKGEINGSSSTLAHEMGHFFSLPHPFYGWDCPYTLDDYTNPVNMDFTLPCAGESGGNILIELHDRSNCNTAGDRICDTPEDYNLGYLFQDDCEPNTSIRDKNNEVITPMVNNFMSYYRECATYAFTPTQKNLMNTDFFTFQRSYIRTGNVPNTSPVDPVTYLSPINGEESNTTTNIVLDWEDTPGANMYIVMYARNASFTVNPVKAIVSESQYLITAQLSENITYYWRVWPYNESQTGAGYNATQNFVAGTGVGVNEIKDISGYGLSPNPVSGQLNPTLTLVSANIFTATLEITNASGQIFSSEKMTIPSGISEHPLETSGLPSGIYFVILHSERGRLVERLMVLE